MDKINDNVLNTNNINGISEKSFNKLSDEQKNIILAGYNDTNTKEKEGGTIGRFLGTNTKNASIHIAFIISITISFSFFNYFYIFLLIYYILCLL